MTSRMWSRLSQCGGGEDRKLTFLFLVETFDSSGVNVL